MSDAHSAHMTPSVCWIACGIGRDVEHNACVPSCQVSSSGTGPPSGSPRRHAAYRVSIWVRGEQPRSVSNTERRMRQTSQWHSPLALLSGEPAPPDARRRAVALHLWGSAAHTRSCKRV